MTVDEKIVLDVDGLRMRYGTNDVLRDVTFQARQGDVLGLVATLPIGAVLGSVFTNARSQGLLTLPILGLIVAPIVLRRMARRESGSSVTERREKALQRVG